MSAWEEFEDHVIAYGRLDSVWAVDEFAACTNLDDVLGRQGGSGEKEEKGVEVAHFGIEYTQCATYRFTDFGRSRAKRPWVNPGLYILLGPAGRDGRELDK